MDSELSVLGVSQEERARFKGELKVAEPLSKHTYYRIGGPASVLAIPTSLEDLKLLSQWIVRSKKPYFFLGSGSNLLVSDKGFDGWVIKAGRANQEISLKGDLLRTGSGVAISSLLRRAGTEGWGGLEIWTGIPGTIGGVVKMNGGTHLGESSSRIVAVEAFLLDEGRMQRFEGAELKFAYRKNHFLSNDAFVWAAEWRVDLDKPEVVRTRLDDLLARRKATQPIDFPSCGSVFKNPAGQQAWQVNEKLGLR